MHLKHGHASAITESSHTLQAEEDMGRAAVQVSWGWFMLQSWAVAQDMGPPSLAPAPHLLQRLRCLGARCGSGTSAKNLGNARRVPLAQRGRDALSGFTPHSPRGTHVAPGCGSCPHPGAAPTFPCQVWSCKCPRAFSPVCYNWPRVSPWPACWRFFRCWILEEKKKNPNVLISELVLT